VSSVSVGDSVKEGQEIAWVTGGTDAPLRATIDGTVAALAAGEITVVRAATRPGSSGQGRDR
jgi:Na+-translocating ferredoxin:NAD+ oxidoreductase RnfC subunit